MEKKKSNKKPRSSPEFDSKREQNVLLEQIASDVKRVAEGHSFLVNKLEGHDKCFDRIETELNSVKSEIGSVKSVLNSVQAATMENSRDIKGLKEDIGDLKTDVGGLKTDVGGLKADMEELKKGQGRLEQKLDTVTADHEQRIQKLEAVR